VWSPDGRSIAFVGPVDDAEGLWVVRADGSDAHPFSGLWRRLFGLDWQPLQAQQTDRTPPVLTVPSDITTNATGPSGAKVNYSVSATDDTDPSPEVACYPPSGSTFPIGATQVTCTATDQSGNSTTKSFNVVVRPFRPTVKEQCKNGGWRNFPSFRNQGECVAFVQRGRKG
jgi:hypothetical protein